MCSLSSEGAQLKEKKKEADIQRETELGVHKVLKGARQIEGYARRVSETRLPAWVRVGAAVLGGLS